MPYFAQLDGNNRVTRIIVADSLDWVETNLGGWWIETHKEPSNPNCAVMNAVWDDENQAFIWPKPFESWVLDEAFRWEAPIPYPEDGQAYVWDESVGEWVVSE